MSVYFSRKIINILLLSFWQNEPIADFTTSTTLDYVAGTGDHSSVSNVSDGVYSAAITFDGDCDAAGFAFETDSSGHAVIRYAPIHVDAVLV